MSEDLNIIVTKIKEELRYLDDKDLKDIDDYHLGYTEALNDTLNMIKRRFDK